MPENQPESKRGRRQDRVLRLFGIGCCSGRPTSISPEGLRGSTAAAPIQSTHIAQGSPLLPPASSHSAPSNQNTAQEFGAGADAGNSSGQNSSTGNPSFALPSQQSFSGDSSNITHALQLPPSQDKDQAPIDGKPESSGVWSTAKAGAVLALQLTEKALDGLPIPGVKGAVGGILTVIETIDQSTANVSTLELLQKRVTNLRLLALQPVCEMDEKDLPANLKNDLEKFVSELRELGVQWIARKEKNALRRFIDAKEDAGELQKYNDGIKTIVDDFMVQGGIQGRLADARQEQALARIEATIGTNEREARLRARTELVNKLPYARSASYNSGRLGGPTTCFEGTREEVLETIKVWISDKKQPNVFWLNGLAGIGKSTIASTISEYAEKQKILGGSFFFSRGDDTLSDPTLVFPTLAFQLAQMDPIYKWSIGEVLEQNADYGNKNASIQLDNLIIKPLRATDSPTRILLFVIDALDECRYNDKATEILNLLLAHIGSLQIHLRIFITSRPENYIRSIFNKSHNYSLVILHNIEESTVLSDIRIFLRAKLVDIPRQLDLEMEDSWPKEQDLDSLAEKSGKLFVYAATAIKFIGMNPPRRPQRHLEILLGIRQSQNTKLLPYRDLDNLYIIVLRNALPDYIEEEEVEEFRWLLGCIVLLLDPLSLVSLAKFALIEEKEILHKLYDLHSIIIVPNSSNEAPRLYHPSFRDFLIDPGRCTDQTFYLDRESQELRLLLRCLDLMLKNLKRDVASIGDYSLLDDEISNITDLVEQAISPEVRYACLYWGSHILEVKQMGKDLTAKLYEFASQRMLNWFEAMSLLGQTPLAVSTMRDVYQWATTRCTGELVTLLYDGYRFILAHQPVIEQSALHVYRSALPFTPHETLIYKTYQKETEGGIHVLHGVPSHWSPRLVSVHPGHDGVQSVAYSSSGRYFATGFHDGAAAVFDSVSCALVMSFKHPGTTLVVVFLPDELHLVTGSQNSTIYLWHILSGAKLRSFDGHTDAVNSLTIDSSGLIMASASSDRTIRIWDITSGDCTASIDCFGQQVYTITFLCDASGRLGSGSEDGVVRLWDSKELKVIQELQTQPTPVYSVALSSDGDMVAAGEENGSVTVSSLHNPEASYFVLPKTHSEAIRTMMFDPIDKNRIVYGGRDTPSTILWDIREKKAIGTFRGYANQVAFSPDGERLVSAHTDGTFRQWDVTTNSTMSSVYLSDPDDHIDWVTAVTFSPDGRYLATARNHKDKNVKLWDAISGKLKADLRGHEWAVYSLAFSPDSSKLASGDGAYTVRVWDVQSGGELLALGGHSDYVKALSFSPDGNEITSRLNNLTVVWDLRNPESPIDVREEENENTSAMMYGESKGFSFAMGAAHWLFMGKLRVSQRRVAAVMEEYRIGGFAFHSDRAVFTCIDGVVLIIDVSQLKSEFGYLGGFLS